MNYQRYHILDKHETIKEFQSRYDETKEDAIDYIYSVLRDYEKLTLLVFHNGEEVLREEYKF